MSMDYLEWIRAEIQKRKEPRQKNELMIALAKSIGVSRTTLYAYLRGDYEFNSEQIDNAAKFLGVESPSRFKNQKAAGRSCDTCEFFFDRRSCRRNPPQQDSQSGDGYWPRVVPSDWCGEWSAKSQHENGR